MIRMKGDHHAKTPSYFAEVDRLRYPNAVRCSSAVATGAYVKS
jgi:hypothetical protein